MLRYFSLKFLLIINKDLSICFNYLGSMRRISLRCICSAIGVCICCILLVFAVSNFNGNDRETKSALTNCDCPPQEKSNSEVAPVIVTSTTVTPQLTVFKPCEAVQKTSPVQRAVLIYYPDHQKNEFFPEVRW